jgi:ankyrin repeat protein
MYAVIYDETEVVRAMIKHGVDVNERAPGLDGSGSESAPIIQAGEYEVVKALLDAGANP